MDLDDDRLRDLTAGGQWLDLQNILRFIVKLSRVYRKSDFR